MTMTKRDLVNRVAHQMDINQNDAMMMVQFILNTITEELAAGNTIEIRNFGVFEVLRRKSRIGRNPNSPKQVVPIPERAVVKFKPGKEMRQLVLQINPKDIE